MPWRTALATAGGLALYLSFPGHDLGGLAVLGPAALSLATHGRRLRGGLWLGLVLGLVFLLPLLSWTGVYVGSFPWLALGIFESLYLALLGGALALTSRLPGWPVWAAALWVSDEALRSRLPFGGFPWGRLAFSQAEGPFVSFAAYGGAPLVTFAVALTGTLLAAAALALRRAWARRRTEDALSRSPARLAALAVAGVLAVPLLGAVAWLPLAGPSLTEGGPTRTVAVVQGNVPRAGLEFNAQRRAVLDNHADETLRLAASVHAGDAAQPDLVIWPENSSDIDPYRNDDAARVISRAAAAIGAPVLVGAVVEGPGQYLSNTGIVWDPVTGPGDTYVKRHPVPLAEYVPYRSFFRFFSDKVDLVRRDFTQGSGVGALDIGGARIGDVICFEVAYDSLVADVVDAGAGMVVVQTNNATFGFTDESEQQLAMSRLRAVEFGRTVVVSATSGISAVIAPDGSVARRSQLFTPDVFVEPIAQRQQSTVAQRLGGWPEWVLTALGVAALGAVAVRAGRRRQSSR
ncbi:apolipoprotein N-acyltransferase [Modestobacter sp. DSM 44400]|uniref:apolipoprotein N-acyltransferase n=1 Tax=Modestobacter sp. DSM 44400 TaxID=1550230 RepID=UPI00089AE233|nr:apolipoprotein N-acyltransferase [Modestobacter sp. DSM 44400]SDY20867.1 apolipoprotein N-acyltransferase [Modestobacter sp. DSM 44400]